MNGGQAKRFLTKAVLGVWAGGMTIVVACLMVSHWVSLPHPEIGSHVDASLVSTAGERVSTEWTAFHFLYGDCPCSRRVLRNVVSRKPIAGITERIVFIGQDAEMQAEATKNGFVVDCVTPVELKQKYDVESAPLLVVVDQTGTIHYSGGYTSRKQGLDIQDETLIRQVVAGEPVEGLPLYGCAVSKSLKAIVDPLGLKY